MKKATQQDKTYIIGIYHKKITQYEARESFEEAKSLANTAGAIVMGAEFIELRSYNPGTFFGSGKVEELKNKFEILKPDCIIVDHELSPVQNRNLEKNWKIRVVDRTGLILDIFAQRARSKEGKLQVELAQYQYLLPRLVGAWQHLKKSQGGIGFRGPGETQLEVDRRRARERIAFLKKNLVKVTCSREIHRAKRQAVPIPTLSLIGYTNAGKSTLFNALLDASEFAEDKLFATLDPKTKRLRLPSGQKVLISDTVGFIRNLPHQLIESFKSTFEEVADSDLLIHVIDASHPDRHQQVATVEKLLAELKLSEKPVIKVLNKIDQLDTNMYQNDQQPHHLSDQRYVPQGKHQMTLRLRPRESNQANLCPEPTGRGIEISALRKTGLDTLLRFMEEILSKQYFKPVTLLIPHHKGKVLNEIYNHGRVLASENAEDGTVIHASLPAKWHNLFKEYMV